MEYPLIKKLGLYVLQKDTDQGLVNYIHADDLELILQNAKPIYYEIRGKKYSYGLGDLSWKESYKHDFKGLFVAEEPLHHEKVTITKKKLETAINESLEDHGYNLRIHDISERLGLKDSDEEIKEISKYD